MLVHQHRHHLNIYGEYVNCYVIVSLNIQFISRESQICQKRCIELIFKDKQQIPYNVFFFSFFFFVIFIVLNGIILKMAEFQDDKKF